MECRKRLPQAYAASHVMPSAMALGRRALAGSSCLPMLPDAENVLGLQTLSVSQSDVTPPGTYQWPQNVPCTEGGLLNAKRRVGIGVQVIHSSHLGDILKPVAGSLLELHPPCSHSARLRMYCCRHGQLMRLSPHQSGVAAAVQTVQKQHGRQEGSTLVPKLMHASGFAASNHTHQSACTA